ncbi:Hypothetical protein NGAL_HAMBI1189_11150 [Neorhizobium galegae bv. officinalis]|uniref:Uncharacterized protein n=1 Tax=Neorhizobium galegae bv. officinalis TaxID=323656 RepID=A0A0T7GF88_NEOGA|nr:Hypothetical protein NGAL_HAMBI1189_11150 [Neorhizobium galegae bv. officinalis]
MEDKQERRVPPEPGTDDARSVDTERSRKDREAAMERAVGATEKVLQDQRRSSSDDQGTAGSSRAD